METELLNSSQISRAAEILKDGGIVAIPTETVYGLAANAYNVEAIKKVFEAKGRPSDNPLIVHISDMASIKDIVSEFPESAERLAKNFWPGPLTMILPRNALIPDEVTGGMDSVAVRYPSHTVAQKIISEAGVPLVAPSANISGSPSPTKFEHVVKDLSGKVDAIVDGGDCDIGLESTVISLLDDVPKILRPGKITPEDIIKVLGKVEVDKAVINGLKGDQKALSPGMKYKHYSPKTPVEMIMGNSEEYTNFVNSKKGENIMALCFDEDIEKLEVTYISYGSIKNTESQAHKLFDILRKVDDLKCEKIYAHYAEKDGLSLAVYNRLVRAAGFDIVRL